ncbi:MAG: hypothetical protein [Microviridae sp.]|nr:MAG: hypothetical protein [Microviridae sp.]
MLVRRFGLLWMLLVLLVMRLSRVLMVERLVVAGGRPLLRKCLRVLLLLLRRGLRRPRVRWNCVMLLFLLLRVVFRWVSPAGSLEVPILGILVVRVTTGD